MFEVGHKCLGIDFDNHECYMGSAYWIIPEQRGVAQRLFDMSLEAQQVRLVPGGQGKELDDPSLTSVLVYSQGEFGKTE